MSQAWHSVCCCCFYLRASIDPSLHTGLTSHGSLSELEKATVLSAQYKVLAAMRDFYGAPNMLIEFVDLTGRGER